MAIRSCFIQRGIVSFLLVSMVCSWLSGASAFFWESPSLWDTLTHAYTLVPATPNARIQRQINILLKDKDYLAMVSRNAQPYLYYVYQALQKRQMPVELALLPIIESDYYPFCLSSARAEGIWQMMHETAGDLHIPINWWFDGRRDVVLSTKGALSHLHYLYTCYHDWYLALAAYNAGEGPVNAALRYNRKHHLSTSYWALKLPRETEDYVPKLLALAYIIKNSSHYHVKLANIPNTATFTVVQTDTQINLQALAQLIHMDSNTLLRLNPGFRRWVTPPHMRYHLIVPSDKAVAVLTELQKFNTKNLWLYYSAKANDTLSHIASQYHIATLTLQRINHISSSHPRQGQTLLIPIDYSNRPFISLAQNSPHTLKDINPVSTLKNEKRVEHVVLANENINTIAKEYRIASNVLLQWNHLASNALKPGQRLTVWLPPPYINFATHLRHHQTTHTSRALHTAQTTHHHHSSPQARHGIAHTHKPPHHAQHHSTRTTHHNHSKRHHPHHHHSVLMATQRSHSIRTIHRHHKHIA